MTTSEDPTSTAPETSMITNKASIDSFNRGPITKFWEAASTCSNVLSMDANMYYGFGNAGIVDSSCYPMGTMKYENIQASSSWDIYYYSPAACPENWFHAETFIGSIPFGSTALSVSSDTTAILCCPSGFRYTTFGHVCTSTIKAGDSVKWVAPQNDDFGTLKIGPVSTSTYTSPSSAYANGLVVLYQSTDVAMLRSVTINPTASVSSTANPTAPTATGPSDASRTLNNSSPPTGVATGTHASSDASSGGLSTGAKVGMGVGIPVALLLGLLFGWFLFRKRKATPYPPPGYDEEGIVKYAQVHEAHSDPPEMGGNSRMDVQPSDVKVAAAQVHQRHELQ